MRLIFMFLCWTAWSFAADDESITVALIGDGRISGDEEGINQEVLAKLFRRIKEDRPDAVFFTGNLITGLEQSTKEESLKKFADNLRVFSQLVKTYLGDNIPVYPVMGNHTFVNSQAVKIFREHFGIENTAPLEDYQLGYTVELGNAQFIVLATGIYERKYSSYRHYWKAMPLLDWVEKELKSRSDAIRYRFVISHEPAFSSTSTAGVYTGIDKDPQKRNEFWNILKHNDALAYISSHEVLYDRSNRGGVWQVITGGVGEESGNGSSSFHHYVLLKIPKDRKKNPQIRAIDLQGKDWDEFDLVPTDRPVRQLRISDRRLPNAALSERVFRKC